MKRTLPLAVCAMALGTVVYGASPLYVSADVPTTEGATSLVFQPWHIVKYVGSPASYAIAFTIPGNPMIDGIERMDKKDNWLFSLESRATLPGPPPFEADPRDVILYDAATSTYRPFFCGKDAGIPDGVNVDAVFLIGGDGGDLVVSFDVPTSVGASPTLFQPSDLVRFKKGTTCSTWTLHPAPLVFDSGLHGVPSSANLTGAASAGPGKWIGTFDAPVAFGAMTYYPGQVVVLPTLALFDTLAGWPVSSVIDGLSTPGNPGRVPPTILLTKAGANITVTWSASCSQGADDYGIYEGTIGSWYSHTLKVCTDSGHDLTETFSPGSGNRYYLVVPQNAFDEGSYGTNSSGVERPVGVSQCVPSQVVTPCP